MKIGRVLVAILIAFILVAGYMAYSRIRTRTVEEVATEALEQTNVVSADEQAQSSTIVRVAGFDVKLSPNPQQVTVLASSQPQTSLVTPLPVPTLDTSGTAPTITSPPAPTDVPTAAPVTVNPTPVPANPNRNDIAIVQHTVQQGETLYGIATRYGTSVSLMAEYGIAQDHIFPGNVLNVPVAATDACVAGQRSHIVLEGENVFRIAIRYNTTKEAIRSANSFINENYLIYTGDVICIP